MNKQRKRFIALFLFFASIFSFLPIKFGDNGQAAEAAVTHNDITVATMEGTILQGSTTDTSNYGTDISAVYSTNMPNMSGITITVPNNIVDPATLNLSSLKSADPILIEQEIVLVSIDGVELSGTADDMNEQLENLGASVTDGNGQWNANGGNYRGKGVNITNLPLGVNKIEYRIKETKRKINENVDANGNKTYTLGDVLSPEYAPGPSQTNKIIINHGKNYVNSTIDYLQFDSYIGTKAAYDAELNTSKVESNTVPFKYTAYAEPDKDMCLSYTFDLRDGTKSLNYTMKFNSNFTSNPLIMRNGEKVDAETNNSNNTISGSFNSLDRTVDIVTIRLTTDQTNDSFNTTYSIAIKYNLIGVEEDYTLRDAGITKYNYPEEADIKAYIGKDFTKVSSEDDGYDEKILTYKGKIYIDERAEMVAIEPKLGRDSQTTAYEVINHYDNGGEEPAELRNGKRYVDFNKGSENELWVKIYKSDGSGNIVNRTEILARYKLEVVILDSDEGSSEVDLDFPDAYLTQPGRDTKINFDSDRRSYDLYSEDKVTVNLVSPNTSKHEYIRVFFGDNTDSDNEAKESKDNVGTVNSNGDLVKDSSLQVDVGSNKQMIVQAYYDKIVYETDENGEYVLDSAGDKVIKSKTPQPIGKTYVFYIQKNKGDSDDDGPVSANALLKNLKVDDGKLKDADGNTGFTSNKYSYTVTVPKANTSAKITATSEEEIYEMTATVTETDDKYDMTSGEALELPLNETGKTTVEIAVTAKDKTTIKKYKLVILNDTRSADGSLANIIVDPGDYDFDPEKEETKVRVDLNVTKVDITPVPKNEKSKVYVDDDKFTGSPIKISLKGSQETEVEIEVVSEDGTSSSSYTVVIIRTNEELDNDDDDDDKTDKDVFYDDYNDCWVDLSKYEEWGKVKGKDAYFDKNGRQVKNSWITTGKYGNYTYYYLNDKGYKQTGWLTDSTGKKYFLDQTTGTMKVGYLLQDGSWYHFGTNGVMHTGWLYNKQDNGWQYFLSTGQMVTNTSMAVEGKVYNFGQDGKIF